MPHNCQVCLCAFNRLLNRKQDVLIGAVTTPVNSHKVQHSGFRWAQWSLVGGYLGMQAVCLGGEGRGAE